MKIGSLRVLTDVWTINRFQSIGLGDGKAFQRCPRAFASLKQKAISGGLTILYTFKHVLWSSAVCCSIQHWQLSERR